MQVQYGYFKQYVIIEISNLNCHNQTFSLIIHILMVPTPKQLIHTLRINHGDSLDSSQMMKFVGTD
jgi:hypothetical protein